MKILTFTLFLIILAGLSWSAGFLTSTGECSDDVQCFEAYGHEGRK